MSWAKKSSLVAKIKVIEAFIRIFVLTYYFFLQALRYQYLSFFRKFPHYDKPEGIAPLDKVVFITGYGLLTGLVIGSLDVLIVSKTYTIPDTLRCYAYWMIPQGGMSATFAAMTFISSNWKEKDDTFNYLIGGN